MPPEPAAPLPDFYWQAGDPITPLLRAIIGEEFADYLDSIRPEPGREQSLMVERTDTSGKRAFIQYVDRPEEKKHGP